MRAACWERAVETQAPRLAQCLQNTLAALCDCLQFRGLPADGARQSEPEAPQQQALHPTPRVLPAALRSGMSPGKAGDRGQCQLEPFMGTNRAPVSTLAENADPSGGA